MRTILVCALYSIKYGNSLQTFFVRDALSLRIFWCISLPHCSWGAPVCHVVLWIPTQSLKNFFRIFNENEIFLNEKGFMWGKFRWNWFNCHRGYKCCEWIRNYSRRWVLCCERTWEIFKSDFVWIIHLRLYSGPSAVECLAKLNRLLKIFSKSFKAMILGFDFI